MVDNGDDEREAQETNACTVGNVRHSTHAEGPGLWEDDAIQLGSDGDSAGTL